MDNFDQFEQKLSAALRADADLSVGRFDPATIARAAMAGRQRRRGRSQWRLTAMTTSTRWPLAAAAVIGVLFVAGAFFMMQRRQPAVVGAPSPTPSASEPVRRSAAPTYSLVPRPAGAWVATGSMRTPRYGHAAVRLLDGKVLVAGGAGANHKWDLTSSEVYDPDRGTWTATGRMAKPLRGFPATLLRDGKVLVGVVGGAEVYDPASGTWSATRKMLSGPDDFYETATLLRNGKVLVTGVRGAQLYDPASGIWTATGKLTTPLYWQSATLLRDGRVLAVGLVSHDHGVSASELYDPASGTWTAITNMHRLFAQGFTVTLLADGRVLVAGFDYREGRDRQRKNKFGVEIFDPRTGTWTSGPDLTRPGSGYQTATLLSDGTVLMAGLGHLGKQPDPLPVTAAELYDPRTGSWTTTGSMLQPHDYSSYTLLLDGRVLVAGGLDCSEITHDQCSPGVVTPSAELYVPTSGR